MASLSDIRRRIGSVKNTRQITRAMKLVAGAKLRRATEAAMAAKPYQNALSRVLARVVQGAGEVEHPMLTVPSNKTDIIVIVLTSDRGLCGGFNNQLLRATQEKIDALVAEGKSVGLLTYGKKGREHFKKRGYKVLAAVTDQGPDAYVAGSAALAEKLVTMMVGNEFERVMLAFNEFKSVMTQVPQFQQVLPMVIEDDDAPDDDAPDDDAPDDDEVPVGISEYIYEPDGDGILGQLLPMALNGRLLQAFLETEAGEHASRMTAMDNATRNAGDIIDRLTLEYNRARQAAITKELIEIVSGAEAL